MFRFFFKNGVELNQMRRFRTIGPLLPQSAAISGSSSSVVVVGACSSSSSSCFTVEDEDSFKGEGEGEGELDEEIDALGDVNAKETPRDNDNGEPGDCN